MISFKTNSQITIKAVGDIMLGSLTPDPIIPLYNGRIFSDSIAKHLTGTDIVFGNLEGVFVNSNIEPEKCSEESRNAGRCYEFGMPRTIAPVLKKMHFNVLNLDNNHVWDYGPKAYELTQKILDEYSIQYIPQKGFTSMTINGKQVALVAFGFSGRSYNISNLNIVKSVIKELSNDHHIIIASFHGGAEGSSHRNNKNASKSKNWQDQIMDAKGVGCASCFI